VGAQFNATFGWRLTCTTEQLAARRKRHRRNDHDMYSYEESVNEPAKLLEQEAVEIEEEIPSEDSESIEGVEPEDRTTAEVEE
jgi:hypothetical protein